MSMQSCPNCGNPVRVGAKFCSHCRFPQPVPAPPRRNRILIFSLLGGFVLLVLCVAAIVFIVLPNLGGMATPASTPTPATSSTTAATQTPFVVVVTATLIPTATATPTPGISPTPRAGEPRVSPADAGIMVYVPAGGFTMGSNDGDSNEKPVHTVYLDGFWIDQHLVSNGLYGNCVKLEHCVVPASKDSATRSNYHDDLQYALYPVIYVSWDDANKYCAWAGKRLPTEAEWEKAARGTDGRIYPWGNSFDQNRLNSSEGGKGDTTQAASYPTGASPYSVMDMAGNVWEWVADWYDPNYYASSLTSNPKGPALGQSRVLRGGSWGNNQNNARVSFRASSSVIAPDGRSNNVGFRCVQ